MANDFVVYTWNFEIVKKRLMLNFWSNKKWVDLCVTDVFIHSRCSMERPSSVSSSTGNEEQREKPGKAGTKRAPPRAYRGVLLLVLLVVRGWITGKSMYHVDICIFGNMHRTLSIKGVMVVLLEDLWNFQPALMFCCLHLQK
jgi:hypothetical protein